MIEFLNQWFGGNRFAETDDRNVICLQGKINWENLDPQTWISRIIIEGRDQYKNWDWEEMSKQRRGLKKLSKIVQNTRIETGYLLASMFLNINVVRDTITTNVIDGKEEEDFLCNPYDLDYNVRPDEISKIIEMEANLQKDKETPHRVVYSITTHDATKPPTCSSCGGKGFFKCNICEGSGREQFVDGYYASGEERIKTGQCSNCYGAGKLKCDDCSGTGKFQLISKQYQIVKSFDDKKLISGYVCISTPWYNGKQICFFPDEPSQELDSSQEYAMFTRRMFSTWRALKNKDLETGIVRLYKNRKDVMIEREITFSNNVHKACADLYKVNQKAALEFFKRYDNNQGKLACTIEKHIAMPIFRIFYSTSFSDSKHYIEIYEFDGKIQCRIDPYHLPELGFIKSLFI